MELKINIELEQLQLMIAQLPFEQKIQLFKNMINELNISNKKRQTYETELNELQKLLLKGPVMSKKQYNDYKELRENFNTWIEKSYV